MWDSVYNYDLIVIGGGSGGLACSRQANELGANVLVLDYVKPTPMGYTWGLGGTCVNVGCIPKKTMHQSALLREAVHDATSYGWNIPDEENITLNWDHLMEEIQNTIKATNWVVKVELRTKKINYLNGMAAFVDKHTINVKLGNGEERQISGGYVVIAAGTRPIYPDIPGAREYGITSDDLFHRRKVPGKTLIVGAGYISMECAGFLSSFGFHVTVMVRAVILRNFDQQMAGIITESLAERGVRFLLPCVPLSVEKLLDNRLAVKYKDISSRQENMEIFDTVIWAVGRNALLDDLNLSGIGVNVKEDLIVVDDQERTNIPNVYAIGDIAKGRPQLTPVAVAAGRLLAKRLFGRSLELMDYRNVPTTLFTSVEYAFVGLTEEAALAEFGEDNLEIYHGYYHPLEYSLPDKVADCCYIKTVAKREQDQKILGFHFIGPNAGDVLQGFAVALNCGLTVTTLFNTVGVHITNAQEITQTFVTKRSGLDPSQKFNCG